MTKPKAVLYRYEKTSKHTLGILWIEDSFFYTIERAWKNNERNVSCIPADTYDCTFLKRSNSGKYKEAENCLIKIEGGENLDTDYLLVIAQYYFDCGTRESAKRTIEKYLSYKKILQRKDILGVASIYYQLNDYEKALQKVLNNKEAHLIALPERYGDLFYANLLFYRLENYYGFDDGKFHIVFHQFEKFKGYPDIKIIENQRVFFPEIKTQ